MATLASTSSGLSRRQVDRTARRELEATRRELAASLLTGQARGTGGDLVPEPGPAGEAELAGHGQLRAGQGQRVRHRPDAAGSRAVARPRGAQQVPGLAAQMIKAGPGLLAALAALCETLGRVIAATMPAFMR